MGGAVPCHFHFDNRRQWSSQSGPQADLYAFFREVHALWLAAGQYAGALRCAALRCVLRCLAPLALPLLAPHSCPAAWPVGPLLTGW